MTIMKGDEIVTKLILGVECCFANQSRHVFHLHYMQSVMDAIKLGSYGIDG